MKKSNLYTQTGDAGTTALVGGHRVPKTHPRLEAYGTIDELNAHLGLLRAELPEDSTEAQRILCIQNRLFSIGSYLATDLSINTLHENSYTRPGDVQTLEQWIDETDAQLPPLHAFLLPGGSQPAAQASVARTVCRRAERHILGLSPDIEIDPNVRAYINRLSDYLFAIGRLLNQKTKNTEFFWDDARK